MVALHGFGPDHRSLLTVLETAFAQRPGYRRIYLDLPGFGRSPATAANTTEMVDQIEAKLAELLGDQPRLLVGQSYGGYLVGELAQRRGELVRGLALLAPLVVPEFVERDVPMHQVLIRDPDATAGLELAERVQFETSMVVQTPETLARFTAELASGLEIGDQLAASRLQSTGYSLPTSPWLGAPNNAPTLIITGRQDSIVGYRDQLGLLDKFPRASYLAIDVAGHNLIIESAALVHAGLLDWIDRTKTF